MKNFLYSFFFLALAHVHAATDCCPTGDKFDGSAAGSNTVALSEQEIKNLGLLTVEAAEKNFEKTLFALGRIEAIPNKQAVISSRIPGRVISLAVNPGENVKQGQELLKIESRQAGDPPPTISFKAPIDGTICELDVRPGDPVEPDRRLMDVTDLREVMAVARIFEHQTGQLKEGMKARIRISAFPGEVFQGELQRLGTEVDRAAGTIAAIFRIANADLRLKPGMRAEFSILTEEKSGALSIPREALLGDAGRQFVYVADYDKAGVFAKAAVTVGVMNDERAEITSGLFPGDRVVTTGNFALQYAGGGKASLKEAMDAAHGHAHGPNGEELKKDDHAGHSHAEGEHEEEPAAPASSSGYLPFILTGLAAFGAGLFLGRRRHA